MRIVRKRPIEAGIALDTGGARHWVRRHPVRAVRPYPHESAGAARGLGNSPQTRELAARACFDCHSNQTSYRWYTYVAPISWYIQHDIDDGRRRSTLRSGTCLSARRARRPPKSSAIRCRQRSMLPVHPEASLTDTERQALIDGLRATMRAARRLRHRTARRPTPAARWMSQRHDILGEVARRYPWDRGTATCLSIRPRQA